MALVLADIMQGTGRYNAARGVVGTVQGVGGSLSNIVAGFIVVTAGYGASFPGARGGRAGGIRHDAGRQRRRREEGVG